MALRNKPLWAIFLVYMLVSGYTMTHHEPWGDEVFTWNIAKSSGSYPQLIENRKFEGHPPAWVTILWLISKCTHNVRYMQLAQWVIACLVAGLILFYSPFPTPTKALACFGYYFLFEYAVLSRNYGTAMLLICCICIVLKKDFRYKTLLYYILLFLLSNVHLLATLLAASLHLYFLQSYTSKKKLLIHTLTGGLLLLPAVIFILPPSDSTINIGHSFRQWNIHLLTATIEGPLRAFLPVQAWWNYHFWNTEFLVEAKAEYSFLKVLNLLIMTGLMAIAFFIFRKNRKSLILFGASLLLYLLLSASVFPLTSARYAGFIFISFFVACWLHYYEQPLSAASRKLLDSLLAIQFAAGIFAVTRDIRLPFSNLYRIDELAREVPPRSRLVTDYWTMNGYVAYLDTPAYCIDVGRELSFVTWGPDITVIQNNPHRYTSGADKLFQQERKQEIYMISSGSPQTLDQADSCFSRSFHVMLIDKREGAIEKGGNLYLYKITK